MTDTPSIDPYRLPHDATPRRYAVELVPDLEAAQFDGSVVVDVEVAADGLTSIVLNAIELTIHSCEVDGVEATWTLDERTERLTIAPAAPLAAGAHRVAISFSGTLNDKLRGFYRSTYRDADGVERVIATTQMQATDCRRAFPCWDEPEMKAVFAITLVVDPALLAIANTGEIARAPRGDRVAITFADTMVMSTYLVAFVVGPLEATESVDVGGTPVRVVHVPGKGHLTQYGLDAAVFSLTWFEDYYGIAYPSDKVDLVALPDFAAGAMENLGCITFRENLLLVDPATSTQVEQQNVVDVVAHELAHMWFGDLVTMRWWNGIWLNEAFATFMDLAACDAYRPEWGRWTSFGIERTVAFETDTLSSTRSVEFEVRSPRDAEGMFDVLTYQKGGALLRMLEQYLGPDRFRAGVSHYLQTHSYGSTETSDLWDAIEHTSGEPVRHIMDTWIWQPGYPLVSASLQGDRLVLRQSPCTFEPEPVSDTVWAVPIVVRHGGGTSTVLLDGPRAELTVSTDGPVVVNAGGHGFFRVAYDDTLRGRLVASIGELDTLERYHVVDDAWTSVVAGRASASDLLELVEAFTGETELAVWQAIVTTLLGCGRLLDDDTFPRFQARVAALVAPALERLGDPVPGESALTAKLRGLLVSTAAVTGGDAATAARCRTWFEAATADSGSVDPELVAAATNVVAATGGVDDYERLLAGMRSAATPQEALRFMYALSMFDDRDLVLRTCALAMTDEVKTQNAPFLLRMCIANRRHGAAAWEFVRGTWADANERFPSNTIVRMADGVKSLNRPEQVADVQAFFAEHPIEQATATLHQILERQRVNAELRTRESERFAAALA